MAQLVKALHYKSEGRGFDSRWCHWNFSLTLSFRPHYGSGDDSVSNRNEYQEYFLRGEGGWCVGLTTLLPSCADCLEMWEPLPPGTLRACSGLYRDCFTFTLLIYEVWYRCRNDGKLLTYAADTMQVKVACMWQVIHERGTVFSLRNNNLLY